MSFSVLNSFGVGESYQYFTNVGPGTGRTYSSVHATWVLMTSVTVPLNFFQAGDVVTVEAACSKEGTANTWNLAMFSNTTATLNGALLIGYCMSSSPISNASLTYSLIQRRLQIITADGTGQGTWAVRSDYSDSALGYLTHDHYAYAGNTYSRIGSDGTFNNTTGLMSFLSTNSMDWATGNTVIIIAGYTSGTTDRIRTEWIKVSGKAEGDGLPIA